MSMRCGAMLPRPQKGASGMARQTSKVQASPASVSISFVLPAQPSRAAAFRAAVAAVLHAGFSFGRHAPGQLVYSYDMAGEQYCEAARVPLGSIATLAQAQACLGVAAPFYNQSIGLAYAASPGVVTVCGRVYDEPGAIVWSLDFGPASWRQLAYPTRSAEAATGVLVDAGRILFTLLPARLLLIGPTALLEGLPASPSQGRLRPVPVAMLAREAYPARPIAVKPRPLYEEQLPRGNLVVRTWDAGTATPARPATPGSARPRARG